MSVSTFHEKALALATTMSDIVEVVEPGLRGVALRFFQMNSPSLCFTAQFDGRDMKIPIRAVPALPKVLQALSDLRLEERVSAPKLTLEVMKAHSICSKTLGQQEVLQIGEDNSDLIDDSAESAWEFCMLIKYGLVEAGLVPKLCKKAADILIKHPFVFFDFVDLSNEFGDVARTFFENIDNFKSMPLYEKITTLQIPKMMSLEEFRDVVLRFPNLQVVDFSGSEYVTGDWFPLLSEFVHLKKVSLYCCGRILAEGHKNFSYLTRFEELNLEGSFIDDKVLEIIGASTKLRSLNLYGCQRITDSGLAFLQAPLHTLSLKMTKITDKGLMNLAPLKPTLKELNISFCTKLKGRGVAALSSFLELEIIRVNSRIPLKDAAVMMLASLPKLWWLDLAATPITCKAFCAFNEDAPLEVLNLDGCPNIFDEDLVYLTHIKGLQQISLVKTNGVTCLGLAQLRRLKKLVEITVDKRLDAKLDGLPIRKRK